MSQLTKMFAGVCLGILLSFTLVGFLNAGKGLTAVSTPLHKNTQILTTTLAPPPSQAPGFGIWHNEFIEWTKPIGDINGDGIGDFAYDVYESGKYQLFVHLGGTPEPSRTPNYTYEHNIHVSHYDFEGVGDLNNDGYDDLMLGNTEYGAYGILWGFYGSPTGLSSTPSFTVTHTDYYAPFGSVTSLGDVNGDGFDDIVAEDNKYSSSHSMILLGLPQGVVTEALGLYFNQDEGHFAGLGDINGDTIDDFGYLDGGYVYIHFGGATLTYTADHIITPTNPYDSIYPAGDVNHDGINDFLIGNALYYGDENMLPLTSSIQFVDSSLISSIEDFNGDGIDDLIASKNQVYGILPVVIYYGQEDGISNTPSLTLSLFYAEAGVVPLGDINGDSLGDFFSSFSPYPNNWRSMQFYYHRLPPNPQPDTIYTPYPNEVYGFFADSIGDVNGDGYDDMAVSGSQVPNKGIMIVWGGKIPTYTTDLILQQSLITIRGLGDVNGDGFDDIGLCPNYEPTILLGSSEGLSLDNQINGLQGQCWEFGALGDVNGDQLADFTYNNYPLYNGKLHLYEGNITTPTLKGVYTQPYLRGDGVGDINQDGFDDFVIGQPYGLDNRGYIELYLGQATGITTTPALTLAGELGYPKFGYRIRSAGDVNADGFDDFMVSTENSFNSPTYERVYFFFGSETITLIPDHIFTSINIEDGFGRKLLDLGDRNGDGFDDIVINSHEDNSWGRASGRVDIYEGGLDGFSNSYSYYGERQSGAFGVSIAGGDSNGDGFSDLLVSAVGESGGLSEAQGQSYLYLGQPTLYVSLTVTQATVLEGDSFSYAVALSRPPADPLTITVQPDPLLTVTSNTLYFDRTNWEEPQWLTATAVHSPTFTLTQTGQIRHHLNSINPAFSGLLTTTVQIIEIDDPPTLTMTHYSYDPYQRMLTFTTQISPASHLTVTANYQLSLNDSHTLINDLQFPVATTAVTTTLAIPHTWPVTDTLSLTFFNIEQATAPQTHFSLFLPEIPQSKTWELYLPIIKQ